MIIARLQGGLGNQLFQYAAAKALAAKLHVPFKLETFTSLGKDKQRKIALHDFQATFSLAEKKEVRKLVFFPSLYRHKPELFSKFGRRIYREPHFHFDPKFFQLQSPVFLDGFWQSPLYFKDIEAEIRRDFTTREELIAQASQKGSELSSIPSVAVHVRRGDFLRPKIAAYHGVMDVPYFTKAIELITQKVPGASIHYFSDDIEWVKKNLPAANAEYVSAFTRSAIEDFYLMTQCRHHIIPNSSFSWWTAWLNDKPGKIVVAPRDWFARKDLDTKDLLPKEWLRV